MIRSRLRPAMAPASLVGWRCGVVEAGGHGDRGVPPPPGLAQARDACLLTLAQHRGRDLLGVASHVLPAVGRAHPGLAALARPPEGPVIRVACTSAPANLRAISRVPSIRVVRGVLGYPHPRGAGWVKATWPGAPATRGRGRPPSGARGACPSRGRRWPPGRTAPCPRTSAWSPGRCPRPLRWGSRRSGFSRSRDASDARACGTRGSAARPPPACHSQPPRRLQATRPWLSSWESSALPAGSKRGRKPLKAANPRENQCSAWTVQEGGPRPAAGKAESLSPCEQRRGLRARTYNRCLLLLFFFES